MKRKMTTIKQLFCNHKLVSYEIFLDKNHKEKIADVIKCEKCNLVIDIKENRRVEND